MARILAVSSQVIRGHVGLSAMVPALQRLGHEVLAMPTILLSNHPGHARSSGARIDVAALDGMLDMLDANGWLVDLDAVMTGYLPTTEHVAFAARAIDLARSRSRQARVMVDPVLGDDPRGLYIDPHAAAAIRTQLVPRASILKPNRFELSWLSGREVGSIDDARAAVRAIGVPEALATSVPVGGDRLANVACRSAGASACTVARRAKVPHGTGDLLSALFMGHLLRDRDGDEALGRAVAGVNQAIENSQAAADLTLTLGPDVPDWTEMPPMKVEIHK